jgi:inositol-phosphate phosphatase/L-galactose 1-phosphate phosphatase/histidinol-phosphatase
MQLRTQFAYLGVLTLSCPPAFIDLANLMADAAAEIVLSHFRQKVAIEDKPDASPVTIADRRSEAAMRRLIHEHVPDHGILGEEYGAERTDADYVWVLDPIDGTKAFITGKPSFGILIALLHRGEPILGIIEQPVLRERWLGVKGQPTRLNGAEIHCRPCAEIGQAALYATAPEMFRGDDLKAFERVRASVKLPRYGADCYAAGLLALGFVDLMVEASLQPYDYLPLVAIVEGAGGVITDWGGKTLGLQSDGRIAVAGDPQIHHALLGLLA